jgi:glutathione S-transferase
MKQLGVKFHEVCISLYKPDTAEKIRQYSPGGRVPVLIDSGVIVWDSLAICEYLAEVFPNYQ